MLQKININLVINIISINMMIKDILKKIIHYLFNQYYLHQVVMVDTQMLNQLVHLYYLLNYQINEIQYKTGNYIYDIYTFDFNRETSGTSGYRLQSHGKFICDTVLNLLDSYKNTDSVLLIGHSMGGIASKLATIEKYCV